MFSLKGYREPTHRLPDWLPWYGLVAPGVVLQKNEVLQKTVAFRGPDLMASGRPELTATVFRLNNALKRLSSGWAIFVEAQRFETDNYPSSTWPHPASLDRRLRAPPQLPRRHAPRDQLLPDVRVAAPDARRSTAPRGCSRGRQREGRAEGSSAVAEDGQDDRRDLAIFGKTVREILDIMAGVFLEVRELSDEETLTYLHSTISTNRHPVRMPEVPAYLDALLPDQAFTPGDIPMLGRHYVPACTITGFPGSTVPGILDQLNHLGIEYRWSTRYILLSKEEAQREFEKARRRFWQGRKSLLTLLKETVTKEESALVDNASAGKAGDVDRALEELGNDVVSYGYLTSTIVVWDRDVDLGAPEEPGRAPGDPAERVRRPGRVAQRAGGVARHAARSSLGERPPAAREHHDAGAPDAAVIRVGGRRAERAPTRASGRRHCPRLLLDGGLDAVPSEPGRPGRRPHVHRRSHRRGQEHASWDARDPVPPLPGRAGDHRRQGQERPGAHARSRRRHLRAGEREGGTSFQPLRDIDDPVERVWASQFVLHLLAEQKVSPSPALKEYIDSALASLASNPRREHRTLSGLSFLLTPELKAALYPYTVRGNYGQIFDADHDSVDSSSAVQMFEMGELMRMGEEAVAPALDYIFHRIEARFDGRPTLLILDEAWLFLRHPTFVSRLQGWLKTLRKKNVYVVFATQEVADAANSPIAQTILQACPTKIYLPTSRPRRRRSRRCIGRSA